MTPMATVRLICPQERCGRDVTLDAALVELYEPAVPYLHPAVPDRLDMHSVVFPCPRCGEWSAKRVHRKAAEMVAEAIRTAHHTRNEES